MRLPPLFWPLTLLMLASADVGMTAVRPPMGTFGLLLPAAALVALALGGAALSTIRPKWKGAAK